jgi:hypothetical protein
MGDKMKAQAVSLNVGEGCGDIVQHMYDLGQEFHSVKHEYPKRTDANRRTLKPYLFRSFCRGNERWSAWAYHTTKGVTVAACKVS